MYLSSSRNMTLVGDLARSAHLSSVMIGICWPESVFPVKVDGRVGAIDLKNVIADAWYLAGGQNFEHEATKALPACVLPRR
jgi:hypothetical protein